MRALMAPSSLLTAFLLAFLLFLENISCMKPLCHDNERSALLQFTQSFSIELSASGNPPSYPKASSWNNTDCCLWDGVECDEVSGHVIGLDLSSSYLYGSFNSNSSLFKLSHLERLNLADNHFNFSHIPSKISSLSKLSYLNLSVSAFAGEIPIEISELHNLIYLDLCGDTSEDDSHYLSLVDFRMLVQNLTKLEALDLSNVNISSSLADIFMNLHSLRYLSLRGCSLIGATPSSLSELTKLEYLDLSSNEFSGEVPFWLENLTKLVKLDLSHNSFTSGGFSWLGKQTKLKYLLLRNMNLVGEIPFCLKNLTQLEQLSLRQNKLKGQIPPWLSNLTQLTILRLHDNELHGQIPESISQLVNLESLGLAPNYLSGTVRFEMFSRMTHLSSLSLSRSNLTLLVDDNINDTHSKFKVLELSECNLIKIPNFIKYQNHLSFLTLDSNNIEGLVPSWMGNVGKETLFIVDLSNNSFGGFEQPLMFTLLKKLLCLDLSNNMLQGPLPPPPLSIQFYRLKNNNLTGEIPSWFCNLKLLAFLDLSANNLSGKIPKCLGNSSDNLMILILSDNRLDGNIPDTFKNESRLRSIFLSDNRLEGRIPRSLANCKMLQILDLGQNQISDTFPIWLGSLPMLEVMVLRSNYLYGALQAPDKIFHFSKLRVLDLSNNELTSTIPCGFFQAFNNMKAFDSDQITYMQDIVIGRLNNSQITVWFTFSLHVANKGMYMQYGKIPNILAALDLSSNKFQGDIPKSIASLKMINILDFSNNQLSGQIPSFLRNLTNLESLDLSNNSFSGKIPQSLTELTFLEYFNVSNNQLTGSVPKGNQFGTFDNSSYQGNLGLCGFPLTNQCGNNTEVSPQLNDDGGYKLLIEVTWKSVAIGYGSGIVGGVVLGLAFYERHKNWILCTFGRWWKRRQRTRQRRTIC